MIKKNISKILFFSIILIIGLLLLVFNRINLDYYDNLSRIMDIQLFGLFLVIIVIILLSFQKLKNIKILKYILILSVFLITSELYLSYKSYRVKKLIESSEKYNDKGCEELKNMFNKDLENNEIVFFAYGLAINPKEIKQDFYKKYKINVTVIGKGCMMNGKNCYNEAFFKYLKSKK